MNSKFRQIISDSLQTFVAETWNKILSAFGLVLSVAEIAPHGNCTIYKFFACIYNRVHIFAIIVVFNREEFTACKHKNRDYALAVNQTRAVYKCGAK